MSSAVTTHWGERILLTTAMLVVILLCYVLMRRGWQRQARQQRDIPAPAEAGQSSVRFSGIYASTTRANQPLTRIVVHQLGTRSKVGIGFGESRIDLHRPGTRSFSIPNANLIRVSRSSGIAGKFVGDNALVVLTWKLGNEEVDTGLLVRDEAFIEELAKLV